MNIRLLKRADIDKQRWDSCVHFATPGNLYGYSWYLDQVARDWEGLVEGDYESVFPLIRDEKKSHLLALSTHAMIPQTGLYSIHIHSPKRVRTFLEHIPTGYELRKVAFQQRVTGVEMGQWEERQDYELILRADYDELAQNYSKELKAGLEQAHQMDVMADSNITAEQLTDFYWNHYPKAQEKDMHTLLRIVYNLLHRGKGFASAMRDGQGQLIAADFFAFSHGKITSLMPTHKGRQGRHALWKLTDMMIQLHSGKPKVLDFNVGMGDIQPQHFGASPRRYSLWSENRLKGLRRVIYGRGW